MTNSLRLKTLGWFAYLMLLALAGEAAEVRLKPRSTVRTPLVRLGDIAEIDDEDAGIASQLSKLPLFPAPAVGKQRLISRQEIQQILVMHEINLRVVQLGGAEEVSLQSASAQDKSSAKATRPASVAAKKEATAAPSESPAMGTVQVAVATRPLRSGETLSPSDVELRVVSGVQPIGQELPKLETLIGQEVKRSLVAGQSIEPNNLQSPRLVHRGDLVTVRSIAPGIVVTARGKATEDGGRGDLVAIDLLETREKVLARVTDRQAVEVYAGSPKYETQPSGK